MYQYLGMEAGLDREQCSGSVNISYGSGYAGPYSGSGSYLDIFRPIEKNVLSNRYRYRTTVVNNLN
jgi:hypothetical protein